MLITVRTFGQPRRIIRAERWNSFSLPRTSPHRPTPPSPPPRGERQGGLALFSTGSPQGILAIRSPKLTASELDENGAATIQIDSRSGEQYLLEASEDLHHWKVLAQLKNQGGTVVFTDAEAVSASTEDTANRAK